MIKWRKGNDYEDITGFCKSASISEIRKNDYILAPAKYIGFEDDIIIEKDFNELINEFKDLDKKGTELSLQINSLLNKLNIDEKN